MRKRIKLLIAIANVGDGHLAPAKAMASIFAEKYADEFAVKIVDIYKEADIAPFNTSDSSYKLVTENWALEKANNLVFRVVNFFHPLFEKYVRTMLSEATAKIIQKEKADVVLANHPLVSSAVGGAKVLMDGKFFFITQITDAEIFVKGCMDLDADMVLAPTEAAVRLSQQYGHPAHNVFGPHFTLRATLAEPRPIPTTLTELNFTSDKPVIMMTSGGIGFKSMFDAVEKLAEHQEWQKIVLCGRHDVLRQKLTELYEDRSDFKFLPFTDRIQDFYAAADVVIAKPGMSTVIETEAFKKKTILTHPVALQEIGNVNYALKSPLVYFIDRRWEVLNSTIEKLLALDAGKLSWQPRHDFSGTEKIVDEIVRRVRQRHSN